MCARACLHSFVYPPVCAAQCTIHPTHPHLERHRFLYHPYPPPKKKNNHSPTHTPPQTPPTHPPTHPIRLGFVREASDNPADWFVDVLAFASGGAHSHNGRHGSEEEEEGGKGAASPLRLLLLPAGSPGPGTPPESNSTDGSGDGMMVIDMGEGGEEEEETKQDATLDLGGEDGEGGGGVEMVGGGDSPAGAAAPVSFSSLTAAFARLAEGRALRAEVEGIVAAAGKGTGTDGLGAGGGGGGSEEKEAEAEAEEAAAVVVTTMPESESEFATTLGEQVKILSRRTLISVWRNPASAAMQFGAMFFFIALIGGIYWRMDTGPTGLQNRVGAFFLLVRAVFCGCVFAGRVD